jgi:phage N-6-adenine-methyltransferase
VDAGAGGPMKAPAALVQSTFDFAIREINALETRIVTAEDDADAMLWEQARQVAEQLDADGGPSQRQLAKQWINARTGDAYSAMHVSYVAKVVAVKFTLQPRPRFRDAYNEIANAAPAVHVSQNTGYNEWYTPQEYIDAARVVLGEIDLDPASSKAANKVVGAKKFYTLEDDGLKQRWRGRVWMNPPYGHPAIEQFTGKLAESVRAGDVTAALVLVNNATETDWFRTISTVAAAVCFPEGRVKYWNTEGTGITPLQGQAFLYMGSRVAAFRKTFSPLGVILIRPE